MHSFSEVTPAQAARMLQRTPVVFRGRVKATRAATEGVPLSDETAVVAVEELLIAPDTFPDVVGQEITVRLKQAARRGEHSVFLVQGWTYGATVGVSEVDRIGALRSTGEVRALFNQASERNGMRMLSERFAGADIVLAGVVTETRQAPEERRVRIDTEHDPEWWEAAVDVEETLKGESQRQVVLLFPASTDELWIDCPKLEPGLRAVFAIRRDQQERGGPGLWVPGLTVIDPMDVQPIDQLDRVRSLVGKSQR